MDIYDITPSTVVQLNSFATFSIASRTCVLVFPSFTSLNATSDAVYAAFITSAFRPVTWLIMLIYSKLNTISCSSSHRFVFRSCVFHILDFIWRKEIYTTLDYSGVLPQGRLSNCQCSRIPCKWEINRNSHKWFKENRKDERLFQRLSTLTTNGLTLFSLVAPTTTL